MATQLERAQKLIRENFLKANVLDGTADQAPALKELVDLLHAAQNPPPAGGSDGSFNEETWNALMEVIRGVRDVSSAFRRTERAFDIVLSAEAPRATVRVKVQKTKIKIPHIRRRSQNGDE